MRSNCLFFCPQGMMYQGDLSHQSFSLFNIRALHCRVDGPALILLISSPWTFKGAIAFCHHTHAVYIFVWIFSCMCVSLSEIS